MKVTYQALTDVGRKRKGNEDSLFVNAEQKLFVVADGMGGHAAGEIASSIAVDAINEFVCLTGGDEEITWPLRPGRDDLLRRQPPEDGRPLRQPQGPGGHQGEDRVRGHGHHGGARCWWTDELANLGARGRQPRLPDARRASSSQLTSDHSWVNEQIQSGVISAEQARSHPLRNVVTRALGGKADLQVDMQTHEVEADDVLLMCSDGLTTMIPDDEIARVMREGEGDIETTAQALVDAANAKGGERQHHGAAAEVRGMIAPSLD